MAMPDIPMYVFTGFLESGKTKFISEMLADDGFSEECISMMNRRNVNITKADTYDWVLTIPKAELDANPNINEEDQNP